MAVTLKNIADACGVDASTVSRALRGDPRVRPRTRELINARASTLGYAPNLTARRLVSGKTLNLWMIIPDLKQAVVQEPAQYLAENLNRQGYDLLITLYQNDTATFAHLMGRLSQNVADGAFIIPSRVYGLKAYAPLVESGFPLVFIDRKPDFGECTTVTTANAAAAADLAKACINAGGNRFIVLLGKGNSAAAARYQGAIDCLSRAGMPFITGADRIPEGFVRDGKVAVIASSSGVIEQFYERNPLLSQTGEIIAGVFDAWSGLSDRYSHIFVCRQDFKAIADRAAELMLRKIEKNSALFQTSEIPLLQITAEKNG